MDAPKTPVNTVFTLAGAAPRLIAQVDEAVPTVVGSLDTKGADGKTYKLDFGADITSGTGGKLPAGEAVSSVESDLRSAIMALPKSFATTNNAMATGEFKAFLMKKGAPEVYSDPALDKVVEADDNFLAFSDFVLNAPGLAHQGAGRLRLHQALQRHGWNINVVPPLTGLGVLAFNSGSAAPWGVSGDHANGLTIMIDAVAHALVYVTDYSYSSAMGKYNVELLFELYDAFGLEDEDIKTYGYKAKLLNRFEENKGFTAWWQLQHQFGYAPLVTKVSVKRRFNGIAAV